MTNQIRLTVLGVALVVNLAALATLQAAMVRGADRAAAEQALERVVITASRYDLPEAQALARCPSAPAAL
jgi:hypothetical protein